MFDYHHYSELIKMRLVVVESTDYMVILWDQLVSNRRRNMEKLAETWEELKFDE